MKKILLTFCTLFFACTSCVFGAYFYADAVEQAIQKTFPVDLQEDVIAEYEAQMNSDGEIDANGMMNVCYAGGFDVSSTQGAQQCTDFVDLIESVCAYFIINNLKYYISPSTSEEKLEKCVFDKTMDYIFSYEKGFQQTKSDPGNCICDKNGRPIKKEGKDECIEGATNRGITTCASGLSVECIKNMTEKDARQYYWTRFYRKYGYYRLPVEVQPAVMQLSVGGTGTVAKELRETIGLTETDCGSFSSVVSECVAKHVQQWINKNGVDAFYNKITQLRADKRSNKKMIDRAIGTRNLSTLYKTCAQ